MTMPPDERAAGMTLPHPDPALDAYIDGRLTPQERTAFEARLLREPALQGEVDAHQRVEAALRSHYADPHAGASLDTYLRGRAVDRPAASMWRRWGIGIAAAVLLLVAAWQWMLPGLSGPPSVRERLLTEYAAQVSSGFVPKEVCTTNEAFAAWTTSAYGVAISPAALPASVQLLGWTRRDTLSSYTGVLLAKVDGRDVAVFMDPSGDTAAGRFTQGRGGINIFSQRIGTLTLYEVTPSDRPAVLPGLSRADSSR